MRWTKREWSARPSAADNVRRAWIAAATLSGITGVSSSEPGCWQVVIICTGQHECTQAGTGCRTSGAWDSLSLPQDRCDGNPWPAVAGCARVVAVRADLGGASRLDCAPNRRVARRARALGRRPTGDCGASRGQPRRPRPRIALVAAGVLGADADG